MPFPTDTTPDTEVFDLIDREVQRQCTGLQLIASENFTSPAVMRAVGSALTNKYTEGYPGKRYYGGNAIIDDIEALAIERAKALFGADHANVQPHSGANANMCAYQALLNAGDTVLGLSLDHGGHLTHGSPVNASGKLYHFVAYKVTPGDERIDMDQVRDLALEHRPKMIVAGTTSYPRRLDPEPFKAIADEVGALFLFDAAHIAGLIAGGAAPNPVPYADVVTFTTHKTLRGHAAAASSAPRSTPRRSTRRCSPAGRAARSSTSSPARRSRSSRRCSRASREYAQQIVTNASALGRGAGAAGVPAGQRRHRQPPDGRRPAPVRRRAHRQGSADRARPGRHHAEQEHHPRRSAQPVRHQRPAHRHAVGHHAGHARAARWPPSPS